VIANRDDEPVVEPLVDDHASRRLAPREQQADDEAGEDGARHRERSDDPGMPARIPHGSGGDAARLSQGCVWQPSAVRERAPWYRRSVGHLGRLAVVLVVAAALVGFAAPREGVWLAVQATLVLGATAAYLLALVRSPD